MCIAKDLEKVVAIPSSDQAPCLDARAPLCGMALEQIEGKVAQYGKVLGGVPLADAAGILVESHI